MFVGNAVSRRYQFIGLVTVNECWDHHLGKRRQFRTHRREVCSANLTILLIAIALFSVVEGMWYSNGCLSGMWYSNGCLSGMWYSNGCLSGMWYSNGCLSGMWYSNGCLSSELPRSLSMFGDIYRLVPRQPFGIALLRLRSAYSSRSIVNLLGLPYLFLSEHRATRSLHFWRSCGLHVSRHPSLPGLL